MASALLAMHSIYIGQLMRPAAAPLIVRMRLRLGGAAIVCDYPHPAMIFTGMKHGSSWILWIVQTLLVSLKTNHGAHLSNVN